MDCVSAARLAELSSFHHWLASNAQPRVFVLLATVIYLPPHLNLSSALDCTSRERGHAHVSMSALWNECQCHRVQERGHKMGVTGASCIMSHWPPFIGLKSSIINARFPLTRSEHSRLSFERSYKARGHLHVRGAILQIPHRLRVAWFICPWPHMACGINALAPSISMSLSFFFAV